MFTSDLSSAEIDNFENTKKKKIKKLDCSTYSLKKHNQLHDKIELTGYDVDNSGRNIKL